MKELKISPPKTMIILVVDITLWAQDVLWTFDGRLFFTFRHPRDDL